MRRPRALSRNAAALLALAEERAAAREIAARRLAARRPVGTTRWRAALALDAHDAALEVEIAGPQAGQLRDAQAAAVEQLERGAVAQAERRGVGVLDEQLALLGREHARQALRQARQRHDRARVQRARADAAAVAHAASARRRAGGGASRAPARRRSSAPANASRSSADGVVDLHVALAQEVAQLRRGRRGRRTTVCREARRSSARCVRKSATGSTPNPSRTVAGTLPAMQVAA